jgi:hypothetical protein
MALRYTSISTFGPGVTWLTGSKEVIHIAFLTGVETASAPSPRGWPRSRAPVAPTERSPLVAPIHPSTPSLAEVRTPQRASPDTSLRRGHAHAKNFGPREATVQGGAAGPHPVGGRPRFLRCDRRQFHHRGVRLPEEIPRARSATARITSITATENSAAPTRAGADDVLRRKSGIPRTSSATPTSPLGDSTAVDESARSRGRR